MRLELCCRVRPGAHGVVVAALPGREALQSGQRVGLDGGRPRVEALPYRRHIISASAVRWMAARGELGQCARTCRR
jgi:hypothetical protein